MSRHNTLNAYEVAPKSLVQDFSMKQGSGGYQGMTLKSKWRFMKFIEPEIHHITSKSEYEVNFFFLIKYILISNLRFVYLTVFA